MLHCHPNLWYFPSKLTRTSLYAKQAHFATGARCEKQTTFVSFVPFPCRIIWSESMTALRTPAPFVSDNHNLLSTSSEKDKDWILIWMSISNFHGNSGSFGAVGSALINTTTTVSVSVSPGPQFDMMTHTQTHKLKQPSCCAQKPRDQQAHLYWNNTKSKLGVEIDKDFSFQLNSDSQGHDSTRFPIQFDSISIFNYFSEKNYKILYVFYLSSPKI